MGAPRAAASGGGGGFGGGLMGMAKGLTDKVKAAVGKDDASVLTAAMPDIKPDSITANFGCHVHHVFREQYADVFVTTAGLCFVGENKLALRVPWPAITSLAYGVRTKSTDPTKPSTYEVSASKPAKGDACLLVFTKEGQMLPLFDFTGFGQTLSAALGKITGDATNDRLEKAFDAVDEQWRKGK